MIDRWNGGVKAAIVLSGAFHAGACEHSVGQEDGDGDRESVPCKERIT